MAQHLHLEIRGGKGAFEVVQFAPVKLGEFAEREHAEMFCEAMQRQAAAADEVNAPLPLPEAEEEADAETDEVELLPQALDPPEVPPSLPPVRPVTEKPKPVKPPTPQPTPVSRAVVRAPEPPQAPEISKDDPRWEKALERLETGAALKRVAEDLGLPFYRLRARWAAAIRAGERVKPNPADGPVSGGPGGVLARGRKAGWTGDQDAALMNASDQDLADVARKIGVSLEDARKRRAALDARMQKLMREE